jgi:L-ascorbate metabolism protein UlaG (beta-lactamase superfamily)
VHLGAVRFGITGPLRYTMTGREAVALCEAIRPRTIVPVHYEGWKHFTEGRAELERALVTAPDEIRTAVRWLPAGRATDMAMAPVGRASWT